MKVILRKSCYVGGVLRLEGEEVEVKTAVASEFGDSAVPAESFGKMKKDELLALAAERGVEATSDNNKDEIIAKLTAQANGVH